MKKTDFSSFFCILVMTAGSVQFLMYLFDFYFNTSGWVWAVLMPLGFIFTFVTKMREAIRAEKQGKSSDWADWIWFVADIGAMVGRFTQSEF